MGTVLSNPASSSQNRSSDPRFYVSSATRGGFNIIDGQRGVKVGFRWDDGDAGIEAAKLNAKETAQRFTVNQLTPEAFEVIDGKTGQRASFRYTRQMAEHECDRLNRRDEAEKRQPVGPFLTPRESTAKAIAEMNRNAKPDLDKKALADALNQCRKTLLDCRRGLGMFANVNGPDRDRLLSRLTHGIAPAQPVTRPRNNRFDHIDGFEFAGRAAAYVA